MDNNSIIVGAFIGCFLIKNGKDKGYFWIKLSSITQIEPKWEEDSSESPHCYFKTYKDCLYVAGISASELRQAINSMLFDPEAHWEAYGHG